MIYAFIEDRCGDLPTAFVCRSMKVSPSGFYEWRHHRTHPRPRIVEDDVLTGKIREIHQMSRQTYGSPRVHAELRLGEGIRCSRKRVERLMRQGLIVGVHKRRKKGTTRRDPTASSSDDLVNRAFDVEGPNRLWITDITEHRTDEGKVYLAAVVDAFSRRVIGWSIADHMRSELVVDALQMAIWRRYPNEVATVVHSDHGSQGGFKWSSQHLDGGGVCWGRCGSGSVRFSCIGGRSRRRVVRRWRGARIGSGSGPRSLEARRPRMRQPRRVCRHRLRFGGSVTLVV